MKSKKAPFTKKIETFNENTQNILNNITQTGSTSQPPTAALAAPPARIDAVVAVAALGKRRRCRGRPLDRV
jgi:hypothetical protein